MLVTLLFFFIGIFLLTSGAELFVRGSSTLALRLRISPLIIGLTVVSLGTSAPELFVSVKSALSGYPGIAVGNVIGSNIANVALILGVSAIITPLVVQRQLVKYDTPFMILITAVCSMLLIDRTITRWDALILILLFLSYLTFTIRLSLKEKNQAEEPIGGVPGGGNVLVIVVFIITGLTMLLFGANMLIDAGVRLARSLGINETIIGISVVAVGTSLPELASSIAASVKKESDIVIGNVVGSNVFNIGLVLGSAGCISPFSVPNINTIDILVMCGISMLLLPLLRTGFRLNRIEGVFLLLFYAGYIFFMWK